MQNDEGRIVDLYLPRKSLGAIGWREANRWWFFFSQITALWVEGSLLNHCRRTKNVKVEKKASRKVLGFNIAIASHMLFFSPRKQGILGQVLQKLEGLRFGCCLSMLPNLSQSSFWAGTVKLLVDPLGFMRSLHATEITSRYWNKTHSPGVL